MWSWYFICIIIIFSSTTRSKLVHGCNSVGLYNIIILYSTFFYHLRGWARSPVQTSSWCSRPRRGWRAGPGSSRPTRWSTRAAAAAPWTPSTLHRTALHCVAAPPTATMKVAPPCKPRAHHQQMFKQRGEENVPHRDVRIPPCRTVEATEAEAFSINSEVVHDPEDG